MSIEFQSLCIPQPLPVFAGSWGTGAEVLYASEKSESMPPLLFLPRKASPAESPRHTL